MKFFILFSLLLFFYTPIFSQSTYFVNVPSQLNRGVIVYNLHATEPDSIFNIIFGSLPNLKKGAGFMFMCSRKYLKKEKTFFDNKKILTPEKVVDSLNIYGRRFFRENKFYILFNKGFNYYIHAARGEYIYMNYEGERYN